jgi:FKBP-type peptidyl-prolyl cis-trans isomerase SlyD
MKITNQCVVALTWTLKDTLGEILDQLTDPTEFLVGGSDLLEAIETAIMDKQAGDSLTMQLEPEQAFGDYNDQLLFLEAKTNFPAEIEEGMAFEGLPIGCTAHAPKDLMYFITDIYPDHVVLDANHPLAGIAIRIQLQIHAVREASVDEIGQGTLGSSFFMIEGAQKHQSTHDEH